jgi:hypothetical protein
MPISPKNKSLRGTNGPGETPDLETSNEPTPTSESEIIREQLDKNIPGPVDSSPASADVPVAGDSGEPKPSLYSATDAKLASRMSREIAQHLGLSGKSRSVKI